MEHFAWRIVSQSENVVDIRKTCYGIYSFELCMLHNFSFYLLTEQI